MFHALLRPEAKATQLACKEWDYFPGVDGKHWAPSAALIKIRLSSSTWPCKYEAEGCCALLARGRLPPAARSSDNVGGHCRIQPRLPSATEATVLSRFTGKVWRRQHNLSVVKGQLYLSSWVWPSSLSTAGSALLQREENFAAYAWVSGDRWRLWVTHYAGNETSVAVLFIFCLDLFSSVHPIICSCVYTVGSGCFSCCSVWRKGGRWLPQVGETW